MWTCAWRDRQSAVDRETEARDKLTLPVINTLRGAHTLPKIIDIFISFFIFFGAAKTKRIIAQTGTKNNGSRTAAAQQNAQPPPSHAALWIRRTDVVPGPKTYISVSTPLSLPLRDQPKKPKKKTLTLIKVRYSSFFAHRAEKRGLETGGSYPPSPPFPRGVRREIGCLKSTDLSRRELCPSSAPRCGAKGG